ncbi:hypothetical protein BN946_scf184908.g89 [Trametes cinnabarina]|uniref:Dolichyl-diphosphooligosaccharide--protein glycosyltransferase subunit 1 n=1 Tax=Pycnoporus cinnabarinus TaxID=5643 RepID=A0A060SAV9_PYCCI|nr:hypothetical protein BN946_scf184908.g89 [Trametes cinnabarina]
MQSVAASLRSDLLVIASRTVSLAGSLHNVASSSRAFQLQGVQIRNVSLRLPNFRNPVNWLRENLAPNVRQQNTEEEIEAARKQAAEKGELSVFESLPTIPDGEEDTDVPAWKKKTYTEHKYSTANFKISHRKLNLLGRQIAGKPIDSAILQMMFSEKRASKRIKSMLVVAKSHATKLKNLNEQKLVVAESWVTKGPNQLKRFDMKGRGRAGIKVHPHSRLHVVLKEGKTRAELREEERARKLKRIVSAGLVREDVPIRNPGPNWAWISAARIIPTTSPSFPPSLVGMPGHWRAPFSFLVSLFVLPLCTSAANSFENTAIVRTVELGGALVHVTTTYAVKALEDGSSVYTLALGEQEHAHTSWLEVKLKGQSALLPLEDFGYHPDRSPTPSIHSYTEPEEVDFTTDSVVTKSGATITYGPFYDIPPSATQDFVDAKQKQVSVHYVYDFPVVEITKLERAAEISHWGANLNIENKIDLHNAGPRLKGHFSRLEHQTQSYFGRTSPHILPGMNLMLPPGIHSAYFVDLIGNVSTSHLRTVPSVPKGSNTNSYSLLELRPRYPVLGSWNYSFTLGWDSPLEDYAGYDSATGKYVVGIPLLTPMPTAVVDEAEIKIILPEGATDIGYFPPYPALSEHITKHITYLDTMGRPQINLKYRDLTDKHTGNIYVTYKVPFRAHLQKPFAVATAFIGLFVIALAWKRVDVRIRRK